MASAAPEVVLDASAVLAMLNAEPGGDAVADVVDKAVISAVNVAEIITALCNKGLTQSRALAVLRLVTLDVEAFDHMQALQTGALRNITKAAGLSLGDRACIALAQRRGLPVMTADTAWSQVALGLEVRVIR